jgi:hypothetical protein
MAVKLHVDLETLQLIQAPGLSNPVSALRFKRGDESRLETVFLRGGQAVILGDPALLEIQFGAKERGKYHAGYLVHAAGWTMPATGAEPPTYACDANFHTTELNAAMGVGGDSELSEITLMGELTWREGSGEPTSTRTFLVVVENDVNRGTEGVPTDANPPYPLPDAIEVTANKGQPNGYAPLDPSGMVPAIHLPGGIHPAVTALTGPASLAAILTAALPPGHVLGCVINAALSFYPLQSGTDAESLPGIVRPGDFHAAANARVWKQVL